MDKGTFELMDGLPSAFHYGRGRARHRLQRCWVLLQGVNLRDPSCYASDVRVAEIAHCTLRMKNACVIALVLRGNHAQSRQPQQTALPRRAATGAHSEVSFVDQP